MEAREPGSLGLPAVVRKADGSRDRLNRLFERLDADATGKVSLAEFQRVFSPSVSSWLAELAVLAEPVDESDREAYFWLRHRSGAGGGGAAHDTLHA